MNKLAIVFAGQGSQYTNMGLDFVDAYPFLKEKEHIATSILGFDVRNILSSTDGRLNETNYTQPLILLASIYAYEAFKKLDVQVSSVAGFSLGEYSALYASGLFEFDQIMKIIQVRSQLMQKCTVENHGVMAAILGLDSDVIETICKKASLFGKVVLANYNSPVQSVISGEEKGVHKAIELAKENGAKRAVLLNVSGAFHSNLMKNAGDGLYEYIKHIKHNDMITPIYMNTTANILKVENLYQEMEKQIQSPVYF
ncbi:MAG: malonyl CoA-acyl carrier protein transacylase, partial [Tenericutes bacterium HGW-Tenericutes-3]